MIKHAVSGLMLLVLVGAVGCKGNGDAGNFEIYTMSHSILSSYAYNIAVPTYTTLDQKVSLLQTDVAVLRDDPTLANLAAAKGAWTDAMASYQVMEAWRFGPGASLGLSKALETFPVDTAFIEATLASDQVLDQDFVAGSAIGDKGFHAVEYLLFGNDNSRSAGELTSRHLDYLVALVGDIKTGTSTLLQAWTTGYQGAPPFQTTFANPGSDNATYATLTDAGGDLMEGIEDALSHAYKKKMQTPLATGMASNLESPFSESSLQDIKSNVLSAQYSYTGVNQLTGANGPGMTSYIQILDKNLDQTFQGQIVTALQKLDAVPAPLEAAMANPASQDAINAAITAIQTAHDTFANQVQPLLSSADTD